MKLFIGIVVALTVFTASGLAWSIMAGQDRNHAQERAAAEYAYGSAVFAQVTTLQAVGAGASDSAVADAMRTFDTAANSLQAPPAFAALHLKYLSAAHQCGVAAALIPGDRAASRQRIAECATQIQEVLDGLMATLTPHP